MRRLAADAGLPLPEFHSDRQANEFKLTLFLHNLLTEEDHTWLRNYAGSTLGPDEAKVLIYVRATGAVDNTACRDFCGSDTLAASMVLRRLRDRGLLEKRGAGSRTITPWPVMSLVPTPESAQSELPLDVPADTPPVGQPQPAEAVAGQQACNPQLATLPPELATLLATLQGRISSEALRDGIRRLCQWAPLSGDQLATLLGKDRDYLATNTYTHELTANYVAATLESAKHPTGVCSPEDKSIEERDLNCWRRVKFARGAPLESTQPRSTADGIERYVAEHREPVTCASAIGATTLTVYLHQRVSTGQCCSQGRAYQRKVAVADFSGVWLCDIKSAGDQGCAGFAAGVAAIHLPDRCLF
jgi:hypothetical protein